MYTNINIYHSSYVLIGMILWPVRFNPNPTPIRNPYPLHATCEMEVGSDLSAATSAELGVFALKTNARV